MLDRLRPYLAVLIVAAIATVAVTVVISDDDGDGRPDRVTVHIDGPDRDRKADDTITTREDLVDAVERSEVGDHAGQKSETPVLAPERELIDARKAADRIKHTQKPLPVAGATANVPGCRTSFVRNQSSRGGVRPQWQIYHYTVSPNRPGWGDVNAIVAFFNRSSSGASSHFVIDAEGHCAYIVPIEAKAWTAAAMNPFGVQYEIINSGREGRLMAPTGYRKLASVSRWVSKKTGIPMRRGSVTGCRPGRTGIVQHKDGGLCAGGHVDITPYSIDATVRVVSQASVRTSHLTKAERGISNKRCFHRREHLAGRKRAVNLAWSRWFRAQILYPPNRNARVPISGRRQLIPAIDAAKTRDRKPWSYRHRGARRAELARKYSGKGC